MSISDTGDTTDPPSAPAPEAGAPPNTSTRSNPLRSLAILLSAPSIFYGVLGVGSTFIVWALIQFDPLRPDFYLSVFAFAGPAAFLVRLHGLHRGWRVPSRPLALVLNAACVAFALLVAVMRSVHLHDPVLAGVIVLLVLGPTLNAVVLMTDPDAAD